MKHYKYVFLILLILYQSCISKDQNKKSNSIQNIKSVQEKTEFNNKTITDSLEIENELYFKSLLKKEISKRGNFIDYKFYTNSKYQIIWGNERFTKLFKDTFYTTNPANVPSLILDTLDYLILHCDCGSECTIDIFLNTKNPNISDLFYDLQDYDLQEGIFVYRDISKGELLVVKNIKTGQKFIEDIDKYINPTQRPIFNSIKYEKGYLLFNLDKFSTKTGKAIIRKIKINYN
jgi:hypothetical protein